MLTESKVRSAKAGDRKRLFCDSQGLYLVVYSTGKKMWVFREQEGGKDRQRVIGAWPTMSLYDARGARDSLWAEKEKRKYREQPLFKELAEEWLEIRCKPSVTEKTYQKQVSRLNRYILPAIGEFVPDEITASAVLEICRMIEARGYCDVSHDVCALVGQILRYGIACGKATADVTAFLKGALKPSPNRGHATMTDARDIAAFVRSVDALPGSPVKYCLMFTMMTMARSGEARGARWTEFTFGAYPEWKISAERMKMRRPHIVPLSRQAIDIVLQMKRGYGGVSEFVFPSPRTVTRPISDMAMTACLRRMGYAGDAMSVHGLRAMASTVLNEHQFPVDCIERQLAHVERNSVRGAYNYAEWLPQRRVMLQWYADYLDALRDGRLEPEMPDL